MCNGNSSNASTNSAYEQTEKPFVRVDVIKSFSEEFPEEYAVIYTSLKDDRCRCVLRVRANQEKALFTLDDGLCLHEEVSMNVEVNALRHESGEYSLECNKDMKGKWHRRLINRWQDQTLEYSCKDRKVTIYVFTFLRSTLYSSQAPYNSLILHHRLFAPANSQKGLQARVYFSCSYFEGIQVTIEGPFLGKQLYIDRMVEDNPEDCSNYLIIKTKYKFPPNKGKDIVAAASYLSATGAINNVNSETHGKFNNSIFNDSHFHG